MGNALGGSSITVVLLELSGDSHDLEMSPGATVADLKETAYPVLNVPVEFQRFIVGESVLRDDERLCAYVQDEQPLRVNFYFSDGGILNHESTAARCSALDSLSEVAHCGRRQVIGVLVAFSEDENALCRRAAVSALAKVAHMADERFTQAVVARLLDNNKLIAVTAVQALTKAAEAGNREAGLKLLEFVEGVDDQVDVMVQLAVIEACVKLPEAHHRRILRSLLDVFNTSGNARVRSLAKGAALDLSSRPGECVSTSLYKQELQDKFRDR